MKIKSYLIGFLPRAMLIEHNDLTLVVQVIVITIIELAPGVALIIETNEMVYL